ncbi:MAG: DUF393 domain-containing protein [Ardenticatenia bacterium]|nr:DUF393 domain-containing protein [Ardenticatenia bacterium]
MRGQHPERALLIYDGDCGLCSALIEWVRQRDRGQRLTCAPYQHVSPERLSPGLTRVACAQAVCLVRPGHGHVTGARAVAEVFCLLPSPWAHVGRLVRPWSPLLEPAYRLIARYRHRLSALLGLPTCRLDSSR